MPVRRTIPAVKKGLQVIEAVGLLVIAVATVIAGYQEVQLMIGNGKVTLGDLLLMFIYLEVLAMVGIFYASGALPVQVPLFIAIVALARYLILDTKALNEWRVFSIAGAITLLAMSALLVRRGERSEMQEAKAQPTQRSTGREETQE